MYARALFYIYRKMIMVEFFILLICSIFIARFLEKKYRVASVAHAILFIILSLVYLFASKNSYISFGLTNIVGEKAYHVIHEMLVDNVKFFNSGISALLITEIVTYTIVSVFAVVAAIKGIKKLVKCIKINQKGLVINNFATETGLYPCRDNIDTFSKTYLIFGKLLN